MKKSTRPPARGGPDGQPNRLPADAVHVAGEKEPSIPLNAVGDGALQGDVEALLTGDGQSIWVLADARVLPEVFTRVLIAKQLLAAGQAETSSQAARLAGLSRSAFYKYKDAVFHYDEDKQGRILTVHFLLQDRPGVLSAVLAAFADAGANILTVNQNIPAAGRAAVSVSARTDRLQMSVDRFIDTLRGLHGVEKITRVAV